MFSDRSLSIQVWATALAAAFWIVLPATALGVQLNVPFYSQCDPAWGSDNLGTCSSTMCGYGCAVTSSAMLSAYYGGTRDPGEFNQCLINNNGYAQGCYIIWANSCLPSGLTYDGMSGTIDSELAAGRPVIAEVTNNSMPMHFVVVTGNDNGQYQINDPYPPHHPTLAAGDFELVGIRRYSGLPVQSCDVVVTQAGETIIDDQDACFVQHGSYWWDSDNGYQNHHVYTKAIDEPNHDCWAEWDFAVADAGDYRVDVYIPDQDADSEQAPYEVFHDGTSTEVSVDQSAVFGWHTLGTFYFAANDEQYIALYDNSGEPLSQEVPIGFDAVRLSPAQTPQPDAGIPEPDGSPTIDGSLSPDASTSRDGSASDGAADDPGPNAATGGCGCRFVSPKNGGGAAGAAPTTPPMVFALWALLLGAAFFTSKLCRRRLCSPRHRKQNSV
jgi:hypothetical protein